LSSDLKEIGKNVFIKRVVARVDVAGKLVWVGGQMLRKAHQLLHTFPNPFRVLISNDLFFRISEQEADIRSDHHTRIGIDLSEILLARTDA
jgi:hypothetical protein